MFQAAQLVTQFVNAIEELVLMAARVLLVRFRKASKCKWWRGNIRQALIQLVASKLHVQVVDLMQQAAGKDTRDIACPVWILAMFSAPPHSSFSGERQASIERMVPKYPKPLLLVRVETFQRRRPSHRSQGMELFATNDHILLIEVCIHNKARRVAKTS